MTVLLAAQALAAYSLAYPAFAAVVPFVLVLALASGASRRRLAAALGAVGAAAVLVALVSLPYLRVQGADPPPVSVMAAWSPEALQRTQSASPWGYVGPGAAPYVGGVALVLAMVGLVVGLRRARAESALATRPVVVAMVATALPLVLMSFGPHAQVLGYRPLAWLWDVVPGLRVFRVPLRFGFFVSLPLAVLGGLAAAALAGGVERRAGRLAGWAIAGALVGAVCWQGTRGPIPLRPLPADTPEVYGWLAARGCAADRCAVLEIPAGPSWDADPAAVFGTLAHGLPVVNGYSGFAPAAYPLVMSLSAQLPEETARRALVRLTGARWLVVHRERLTAAERGVWDAAAVPEAARFGDDVVYELPAPDVDWRADYVAAPPAATFAGTPLTPLPASSGAELRLADGLAVSPGGILRVATLVTNTSGATWPALTSRGPNRVSLALTWIGPTGQLRTHAPKAVFLPADLGPGQGVRVAARLTAPAVPGTYVLEARVVQEGRGPLAGEVRASVRVAP
jgi:hypothetical protein